MSVNPDLLAALVTGLKSHVPRCIGKPAFRALKCGTAAVRTTTALEPGASINERRAAVALVLRHRHHCRTTGNNDAEGASSVEILLIRRAINERDPWSGDVALPGGKVEAGETDFEAAIRECKEEVGLDLTAGGFRPLGQLNDRAVQRGKSKRLILSAFVFMSNEFDPLNEATAGRSADPHILSIQPDEVADAWWANLDEITNTPVLAKFVPVARSFSVVRRKPWLLRTIKTIGLDRAAFPSIPIRRNREVAATVAASSMDGKSLGSSTLNESCSRSSGSDNRANVSSDSIDGKLYVEYSRSHADESDATAYVLWGLTLGVVSDLLEVASLEPLTPKGAPSFTFPLAPTVLDATARALYRATSGSGFDWRGIGAATAVAAVAIFAVSVAWL